MIDLTFANQMLTEYQTALSSVLKSQSYTILGRTLTRADLKVIQEGLEFWDKKVSQLSKGNKLTVKRIIPIIE